MRRVQKKGQKMDLNTFLADENTGGSWADEMDMLPTGPSAAPSFGDDGALGGSHLSRNFGGGGRDGPGGFGGPPGRFDDRPQRAEVPIPSVPPFTAFVGNLSFETTEGDLEDFFGGLGVKGVRMAAPSLDGKPRGFGYVEFETVDGLKNALTATGTDLQGRSVRVSVAEAKESRFGRADEASTWERSGPLPSLPGRSGGFGSSSGGPRTGGFGDRAGGFGYEEVERDAPVRGGKFVPSAPSEPRRGGFSSSYGDAGSRPPREPYVEVERDAPVRGGKFVPSAPPASESRRMFSDREPSRADEGSWERKGPSGVPPRGTGFASDSPASARRPLQLSARSAADASTSDSSAAAAPSSRASPFGAARPIDTAAKEREVDEKLAKQRAEAAAAQAARDKEREEKKNKLAETPAASAASSSSTETNSATAAAAAKSDGAWVRRGPLPPSQQQPRRTSSNRSADKPAPAALTKDLPPPVPAVAEPAESATTAAAAAAKIERPAHRKEGFSYSKAAGKSDNGVEEVTEGVEQAKLE
ncbi:hypothetical protein JCM3774_001932 [Rhodotorula dairenensis]